MRVTGNSYFGNYNGMKWEIQFTPTHLPHYGDYVLTLFCSIQKDGIKVWRSMQLGNDIEAVLQKDFLLEEAWTILNNELCYHIKENQLFWKSVAVLWKYR